MSHLTPALGLFEFSTGEIVLVVFLCLLMFGSKKLPELARAMGQSMKEFKKAANEVEDNFKTAVQEEERKKAAAKAAAPAPTQPAHAESAQSQPAEKL